MTPDTLTDRPALERMRRRHRDSGLFLHREALAEVEERLSEVNRSFTSQAVVTGFPDFWRAARPQARIVPDTDRIELSPGAHDLVIHAFGLHWADDPVGQLIQSRRALRPDGLFMGVAFGGQTLNELRTALAAAEIELRGGLSPRIAPMAEIRDLGGLLQRAGLALPVADSLPLRVDYADLPGLMRDLRDMGERNVLAARDRRVPPRALFARAAEIYEAQTGARPGGRITATFELIFLTGWAPDESQQKPLRPGSAAARLADALGSEERTAGEVATPRRD
ncbi:SAM-dependent methyltransferase [Profundibacterium mesophilum]|uniref:Methyltransferase n=1 Tax=Profundibacterium mesophilum KAUST100406-0324 TaxID=1037889 RepID=A0A921TBW9_9RHOB|nr:SAM-dependent methyltransferase [Profundibacterium mesophilum]KAF0676350.1 Methyltransferase [Profundibacterium mesophilum KAUST100406-0324]